MQSTPDTTGGIAPQHGPRRAWRVAAAVAVAVLASLDHITRADASDPPHKTTLADLATHVAASDSFYLLLDVTRAELTLELHGAVLHSYKPIAIETGTRRVAWKRSAPPAKFEAARWRHGRLTPPRPEERLAVEPGTADSLLLEQLRAPGPANTLGPEIFWITFEGDRELLIQVDDEEKLEGLAGWFRSWGRRIHAIRMALRGGGERWRVTLPRTQADHLYRSLPPDAWLLIYRGTPKPPS